MIQRVNKVSHPKLFEVVAEQLRAAIVRGELRPGDRLPFETELAEQFGVSRGPVREAIRELAREGLVVDLPRRGTVVSAATLNDLIEVYDVREALEAFAMSLVIQKATPADLARVKNRFALMKRAFHSRSTAHAERVSADLELHREIFRVAGNSRMLGLFEQLATQTALLLRTAMEMNPTLQLSPPDAVHEAIVDALTARDASAAGAAVSQHYRHTRDRLFTFIEEQPGAAGETKKEQPGSTSSARSGAMLEPGRIGARRRS